MKTYEKKKLEECTCGKNFYVYYGLYGAKSISGSCDCGKCSVRGETR